MLVFSILVLSCNKENPSEPEKQVEQQNTNTIKFGPQGGTTIKDNIEIQVPAGTFSSEVEVKVTKSTVPIDYFSTAASEAYLIENIPALYSQPIEISITPNSDISGDTLAAIYVPSYITSKSSVQEVVKIIRGTKNGNKIKFMLPNLPDNFLGKGIISADGKFSCTMWIFKGWMSYTTNTNNFQINYQNNVSQSTIIEIGGYFESAFNKIKQMGFDYSGRTKMPFTVNIKKNLGIDGAFVSSNFGRNNDFIDINESMLSKPSELKATIGHEFFHSIQSLYCPSSQVVQTGRMLAEVISSNPKYSIEQLWFDEATSTWFEGVFLNDPNYVSPVFLQNSQMPLSGYGSITTDPQGYGYGMCAFIKYITSKYGDGVIAKTYQKIKENLVTLDALSNATNFNFDATWHMFIRDYLSRKVYTGLIPSQLNATTTRINSLVATEVSAKRNYSSASGKIYSFVMAFTPDEKIDGNITFTVNDGEMSVFKVNGNYDQYELLGIADTSITIKNIRELATNKEILIVSVSKHRGYSPYTKTNEIDFKYKIDVFEKSNIDLTKIKKVSIYTLLPGSGISDTGSVKYDGFANPTIGADDGFYVGSFTGNVFKVNIEETKWWRDGYTNLSGSITLTYDPVKNIISELKFEVSGVLFNYYEQTNKLILKNVPFRRWNETMQETEFGVFGSSTASNYVVVSEVSEKTISHWFNIKSDGANNTSKIVISFKE